VTPVVALLLGLSAGGLGGFVAGVAFTFAAVARVARRVEAAKAQRGEGA
jgi:hypothetical protein